MRIVKAVAVVGVYALVGAILASALLSESECREVLEFVKALFWE